MLSLKQPISMLSLSGWIGLQRHQPVSALGTSFATLGLKDCWELQPPPPLWPQGRRRKGRQIQESQASSNDMGFVFCCCCFFTKTSCNNFNKKLLNS
ncbi:unnamed protein product [Gulo gulo]|uniref:Uncharacterized protein n=1 Tax=Gulo gulo TaxID=48420 RepID=A0A9X9M522_GULGU|nr:unnamed protein product [Gulo gulo]